MRTKTILLSVLAVFTLTAVSGCQYLKKRVQKTEKSEFKLTSAGKTRVEIENTDGDVNVITTDDTLGTITIIAEKTDRVRVSEQDNPLDGIKINIDSSGNIIKIDTEVKHFQTFFGGRSHAHVDLIIKIPAKLQVYVTITNGKIVADNLQSESKLENVNGSIYVKNCSGMLNLETVNGSIKANVDSTSGITAETVNGSISIGNLKYVNAEIDASSSHGKVKFENLNFSSSSTDKKSLTGRLGDGKNQIKLSTVNGSIKLDGNYISVNTKEQMDFDFRWEFDDDEEPIKIKIENTDEKQGIKETAKDSNENKEQPKK